MLRLRFSKFFASILCAFCLLISFTSQASAAALTPLNDNTEFVKQVYQDFLNRQPDTDGLNYWVGQLEAKAFDRSELVEQYLLSAEFGETVSPVVRLYFTYYQRIPDYDGLMFWVNSYAAGMSLNDISDAFATAQEFIDKYGSLGNEEFISKMYINVYGRQPDADGLDFWTNILDTVAMTRGQVMVEFSSAEEYLSISANQVYVTMTYMGLMRRAPEQEGFEFWANSMDLGVSGLGLIDDFLNSEEYAARFDTPGETGFTIQMLDASQTYYVTYAGDYDGNTDVGTTQETLVFSGSNGSYQVKVTVSYFDVTNTLVRTHLKTHDLTLNQDGTLTVDHEATVSLIESNASYLRVSGVEGADTWEDFWHLAQPDGWMSAPSYQVPYAPHLQYRVFESSSTSRSSFWIPMTKNDANIQEADVNDVRMYNSTNTLFSLDYLGFDGSSSMDLDCRVSPCSKSGPYFDSGFYGGYFNTLSADTYSFELDVVEGHTLSLDIPYPGPFSLPIVTSSYMHSAWVGNDLVLSWTNPGTPSWSDVDQIRIILTDGADVGRLAVKMSPSAETVTINESLLTQAAGLGDGTLSQWRIQTRAYDSNNMNFARGYSNKVNIVAP